MPRSRDDEPVAPPLAAVALAATPLHARDTIKIPSIIELSGAGATVGLNWRDGSSLAVEEINAAGGVHGT